MLTHLTVFWGILETASYTIPPGIPHSSPCIQSWVLNDWTYWNEDGFHWKLGTGPPKMAMFFGKLMIISTTCLNCLDHRYLDFGVHRVHLNISESSEDLSPTLPGLDSSLCQHRRTVDCRGVPNWVDTAGVPCQLEYRWLCKLRDDQNWEFPSMGDPQKCLVYWKTY